MLPWLRNKRHRSESAQEALINLLGEKGIIKKEELIAAIKKLRREQSKPIK